MWSSLARLLAGPLVKEAKEEPNALVRRSMKTDNKEGNDLIPPCKVKWRQQRIVSYNLQDYEHHFKLAVALATANRKSPTDKRWLEKVAAHRQMTIQERYSFKKDRGPVWKRLASQSPATIKLILLCGLGAMVQGWDEAAINGAQVYFREAYGLPADDPRIGIINGIPYACCVLSCVLSWPLNKFLGRRWTIFIAGLCSVAFALGQSFANDWKTMLILRAFLGFGIGPKSVTIPIYAAEVANASLRGALVMSWQLFTALGIMFGYLSGVAFANTGNGSAALLQESPCGANDDLLSLGCSLNWRLMIGSPAIAPVLLCLYIFVMPESPRWLIARAQHIERSNDRILEENAKRTLENAERLRQNAERSIENQIPLKPLKPLKKIDLEPIYISFVRLRGGNKLKAAKDMLVQDVLLWEQKEELDKDNGLQVTVSRNEQIQIDADGILKGQSREEELDIQVNDNGSRASEVGESDATSTTLSSDSEPDESDDEDEVNHRRKRASEKRSLLHKAWEEIYVLFSRRRNRNAFVASFIVMLMQQYCGINVLIYYSTQILFQTTETGLPVLWNGAPKFIALSSVVGAANFIFGLPAIFLIDRRGRRQLLLRTFPLLAIFAGLVAIGSRDDLKFSAARNPLILVGMYAFVVFYSYGEGPVPFVYASESFPQDIRDLGMSVVTSLNWALNFVVAVSYPSMSYRMGVSGTFAFYSGCCAVGTVLIFLFVPETCQKELENLDEVFQKSMLTFAGENVGELVNSTKRKFEKTKGIFRNRRVRDEEAQRGDGIGMSDVDAGTTPIARGRASVSTNSERRG